MADYDVTRTDKSLTGVVPAGTPGRYIDKARNFIRWANGECATYEPNDPRIVVHLSNQPKADVPVGGKVGAKLWGTAEERKNAPMFEGLLAYFPNALAAVAHVSKVGNDQHNPGQPMHWDPAKSSDEADCIIRHLAERGSFDESGSVPVRHSAKVAWRALALLERELLAADPTLKKGINVFSK